MFTCYHEIYLKFISKQLLPISKHYLFRLPYILFRILFRNIYCVLKFIFSFRQNFYCKIQQYHHITSLKFSNQNTPYFGIIPFGKFHNIFLFTLFPRFFLISHISKDEILVLHTTRCWCCCY